MKALAKLKKEPGIWMTEVEEPTVGANEFKIKIHKTAICGTDIHIYRWDDWAQATVPVPLVTGHEFAGEITELGEGVTGLEVGMRVSGEGHLVCGQCRNCRAGKQVLCPQTQGIGYDISGCFGEYFVMPASNVFPLPDEVSDDLGSILDPMGNAVHAALTFNLVGEDVLIAGAGPIGIMAVAIAKHAGARHVVISDVNEYRLDLARKMGATVAVNVQKQSLHDVMAELGMKEGFDVGLEMSGNPEAFNTMIDLLISGGKVALMGIPPKGTTIDWHKVIFKSINIKGIYGREMYETWYKMVSMLQSGLPVAPVITHQFAIDDYEEAFALMDSGQSGKVILDWT